MNVLRKLSAQLASSTRTNFLTTIRQENVACLGVQTSVRDSIGLQAGNLHSLADRGGSFQQPSAAESREQVGKFSTSQPASAPEPRNGGGAESPPAPQQAPQARFAPTPGEQQTPHAAVLRPTAAKIGTVYVQSTKNNTICTLVDTGGMPVAWASAGSCGFKNARKSTPYAAQATAERIAGKSMDKGWHNVRVVMKGLGFGKQSAVRALIKAGLNITEIHEHTPVPHNGCRPPKKRRV